MSLVYEYYKRQSLRHLYTGTEANKQINSYIYSIINKRTSLLGTQNDHHHHHHKLVYCRNLIPCMITGTQTVYSVLHL